MNTVITTDPNWTFPYCPSISNLHIDWVEILAEFPCLQPLANCQQNPLYHGEGNVWIHTQLVCESLVTMTDWRIMPETD